MSRAPRAGTSEGLAFPGHFLIRVEIDGARHVLDPFNNGLVCDAAEMRALLQRVLGPEAEPQPRAFRRRARPRRAAAAGEQRAAAPVPSARTGPAPSRSLDRMLAIAPDRPELLFEAGQINARLDKRRAAIAALRALPGDRGRPRPIASCASAPLSCCRNCAAGLTDAPPLWGGVSVSLRRGIRSSRSATPPRTGRRLGDIDEAQGRHPDGPRVDDRHRWRFDLRAGAGGASGAATTSGTTRRPT